MCSLHSPCATCLVGDVVLGGAGQGKVGQGRPRRIRPECMRTCAFSLRVHVGVKIADKS